MSFSTRFIKATVLAIIFALSFGHLAPIAQAYSYRTPATNLESNVPDDQHTRAQTALTDILAAFTCQLIGTDPIHPQKSCVIYNPTTGKFGYASEVEGKRPVYGAVGALSNMIISTYQLPIHLSDYTDYLAKNFRVANKAYAQEGIGFDALKPLQNLWTAMRDLAYLAFVVIFVLIGLGIMLRVKIDPRAVMTIQNQIPKIIISILLITFSYAISGLLIDLMWVSTYVGINIISSNNTCNPNGLAAAATNNLLAYPFYYVNKIFAISPCESDFGIPELGYYVGLSLGDMITSSIGTVLGGDGSGSCGITDPFSCVYSIASWMLGLVPMLIVYIAILVQLFRVWFMLIKGYFYIILYTILAPGYILLGLIPGTQNFGFEQWLRNVCSALAMYPVTVFLFLLAAVVSNEKAINSVLVNDKFIPPLTGNPAGEGDLGRLIALGAILIAPEVTNMMRNAFKSKKSSYVPQIFTGFATGAALGGKFGGMVTKPLFATSAAGPTGPLSYLMYQTAGKIIRNTRIGQSITGNTWSDRWLSGTKIGKYLKREDKRQKLADERAARATGRPGFAEPSKEAQAASATKQSDVSQSQEGASTASSDPEANTGGSEDSGKA